MTPMVGEGGSGDGDQGGSCQTRQRGRSGGGKAYAAKECVHCCNGVKQERDDLMFFVFFPSPAKAELTEDTSPKTLLNSLSAMDGHDRPLKNQLRSTVVSC
jgi:hypothetical protein